MLSSDRFLRWDPLLVDPPEDPGNDDDFDIDAWC